MKLPMPFFMTLLLATPVLGQQLSDDQIAAQFVPPTLANFDATHPGMTTTVTWKILPVDLDHTGRPDYLAIAYGNDVLGMLRVIRTSPSPTLASETHTTLCDSRPVVTAIDLDGDGKPELDLDCAVGNHGNRAVALFRWTKSSLATLNPPSKRVPGAWTPFTNANFVDTDGDGVMEVLEPSGTFGQGDDYTDQSFEVYTLVNGQFVKAATGVAFYDMFIRDTGAPRTEENSFSAPAGPYTLIVSNGDRGQHVVNSAVIAINGNVVLTPDAFSKRARIITAPVTLTNQNTISVQLRSDPGSLVHVILRPAPTTTP